MGVAPIPWTATMAYADRYLEDEDEKSEFVHYIREMDGVFLRYHNSKAKQSIRGKGGTSK